MMLVMQLMQTSFKTTIYTIMNWITANIASHICRFSHFCCFRYATL